ncbi:DUF4097 family beta strand repeat-containing protein [Streptomyces sp. NPDC004732]|uniref:DUF4097 family beta strand repeat-containing protein n=1 Tax=Streptomyces sp. NPDC004732 TaxID=3154290 RepID=UPI0033AA9A6E
MYSKCARNKLRPLLLVTASVTLAGAVLTACDSETNESTSHYQVDEKVTSLRIRTNGGNTEVVATDGPAVRVTEKFRYKDKKPHTEHVTRDGELSLNAPDCNRTGSDVCGVDYTVEVPRGIALTVDSGGGNITTRGLAGTMEAQSDGGNVRIRGAAMKKLSARTGGGNLDVSFAAPPERTETESEGGNVTVRLPKASYTVDAKTDGGNRKVDVTNAPTSPHKVTVRTSGGNATVVTAS